MKQNFHYSPSYTQIPHNLLVVSHERHLTYDSLGQRTIQYGTISGQHVTLETCISNGICSVIYPLKFPGSFVS